MRVIHLASLTLPATGDGRRGALAGSRLRHEAGRHAARLALRRCRPGRIPVVGVEDGGRPYGCDHGRRLALSITHGERYALAAASDDHAVMLGIDIERVERFACCDDGFRDLMLAPAEKRFLSNSDDAWSLARVWTTKEAFVKALGSGFREAPCAYDVSGLLGWGDPVLGRRAYPIAIDDDYSATLVVIATDSSSLKEIDIRLSWMSTPKPSSPEVVTSR